MRCKRKIKIQSKKRQFMKGAGFLLYVILDKYFS